jgi:hypothetical protein
MAFYSNPIVISSGRALVVQQPSDDRYFYENVDAVETDIQANQAHLKWHYMMPIFIAEVGQWAAWFDVNDLPGSVDPANLIANTEALYDMSHPDPLYANKQYAFYRVFAPPTTHTHVEADITDLDKYTQTEVNNLLSNKEDTLPANGTGQIAVLQNDGGVLSWVVLNAVTAPPSDDQSYIYRNGAWEVFEHNLNALGGVVFWSAVSQPRIQVVPGNASYILANPGLIGESFRALIAHDGVHANSAQLTNYPVNGITPFHIPQGQIAYLIIIGGVWRTINTIV